jgi:hypothetical protein
VALEVGLGRWSVVSRWSSRTLSLALHVFFTPITAGAVLEFDGLENGARFSV